MRLLILGLTAAALLGAKSFEAVHVRAGWPDGQGVLHITAGGVRFEAKKEKHSHEWSWLDIQHFDRMSETGIDLLTYEDQSKFLGRDKSYRFRLTGGSINDELMGRIEEWFGRPVTDRVPPEADGEYELPVKHLHSFGGCEGTLRFTDSAILYVTGHEKDAREWLLERNVASVWSADRYSLEIHVFEKNRREFSRSRVFKFDLKEELDSEFYRRLKRRLHRLGTARVMKSERISLMEMRMPGGNVGPGLAPAATRLPERFRAPRATPLHVAGHRPPKPHSLEMLFR